MNIHIGSRFGVVTAVLAIMTTPSTQALAQSRQTAVTAIDAKASGMGHFLGRMLGTSVVNENGEVVGDIDDLIISEDQRALYVIISVGGLLGIGSRQIAVRYGDLKMTSNVDVFVLEGATEEGLKSVPEFVYPD
ncbi:MAG: PRC-barrel domain-containing protein [Rhodospirillaceae bacterium]|nr:PRC-barrel domain-containing protein [Rhodospirillaceae bacterium]